MCSSQRSQAFELATTTEQLQVGGGYTVFLENQKALKNTFQATTFKVEENSRTFKGVAKNFQGVSLKFKDSLRHGSNPGAT